MQNVDPKRAVIQITQRLSLRKPQAEALRRLDDIVDLIAPSKDTDVAAARDAVRAQAAGTGSSPAVAASPRPAVAGSGDGA